MLALHATKVAEKKKKKRGKNNSFLNYVFVYDRFRRNFLLKENFECILIGKHGILPLKRIYMNPSIEEPE